MNPYAMGMGMPMGNQMFQGGYGGVGMMMHPQYMQ
jgi:hypothetical protein